MAYAAVDATGEALAGASDIVNQPVAWIPDDLHESACVLQLSDQDLTHVDAGVEQFKKLGLDGDKVSRANFPLPDSLKARLKQASLSLHTTSGRGFCVVRGRDPRHFSNEDNVLLFLAFGNYIGGEIRGVQDRRGTVLVHVTDNKQWKTPFGERYGIHTNLRMTWHNDMGAEILALHIRWSAVQGGEFYVVSASTIYLDLLVNHPEVVKMMLEPNWPIQTAGNPPRHVLAPLLQIHDGKVMMCLDSERLGRAQPRGSTKRPNIKQGFLDAPMVPDLTAAQRQALAVVSEVATKYRYQVKTQTGDMLFLNNFALLHARDAYVDGHGLDSSRHLVRMWLRSAELGWDVPAGMRVPWEAAYGVGGKGDLYLPRNARAGWKRTIDRKYPIVPAPDYKAPKYSGGSAAYILDDTSSSEDEAWDEGIDALQDDEL